MICGMLFLGFTTKASTGETNTGTTITYTGSLISYLNTQEKNINTMFTTVYAKVYSLFTKTGLNILKSIDYQSLVCLWAIKDGGLLAQFQKDKTDLAISFKKDFIDLENQILSLEEKQDLQESDNVNVFDAGTTYESEKAKLKNMIDAKVTLHKWFIVNFETNYTDKINNFLTNYLQYKNANQSLLQGIQGKMAKVQNILSAFAEVESGVNRINAKITGLDDLIKKLDITKAKWLSSLDKTIQMVIDKNVRMYKKLANLADTLTAQKTYVLGQYTIDLDGYIANNLQNRYDRTKYLELKKEVENFKSLYFTTNNQLNCSSVISATDVGVALSGKIAAMKLVVGSWLSKIETEGVTSAFKDQLYSGFQTLYIVKFKQRYAEYVAYLKNYIKTALRNLVASLAPTTTTTTTVTTPATTTTTTIIFNRPFKKGEWNEDIKVLQTILANLWFYTGPIDGVYSQATTEAVYKFQLSKGLVNANNMQARWYFGPATRNAINNLNK